MFDEFLRSGEGEVPVGLLLPEPETTQLAESVISFATINVRLPVSISDWRAVPQQRALMLTGLLRFSRSLREKVSLIEADVSRLSEAGPSPLRNPDVAVKISVCESELKELEARMDSEQDDDLVDAWRRKRQELKQLRSGAAGGLSPEVYGHLVVVRLCVPKRCF